MMLQKLLDTIDEKKRAFDAMRPISLEYMEKIRAKFRLEYNYHSNHLEGNSLTMAETYSFLSTSLVSSEKVRKFSDYEEMKGHDDAVTHYNLLASLENTSEYIYDSDFHLSHKLIKEINAMLLVKDHKKMVKDQYGELYPVDVIVGQYKNKNNHVQRKDGTMFHFAPWEQVQYLMTDLIDRYTHNKDIIHPLILASIFHYKFIRIHPFDDGNGRTARFVTNMILMHYGHPIVIVPSDENIKQDYYNAIQLVDTYYPEIDLTICLQDTDTVLFDALNIYFAQRLIRSLDQVIAGASGENIFTPGDIIKKFKLELASESNKKTFQLDRTWLDEGENFKHFWEKNICNVVDTVNMFIESVRGEYVEIDESFYDGGISDGDLDKNTYTLNTKIPFIKQSISGLAQEMYNAKKDKAITYQIIYELNGNKKIYREKKEESFHVVGVNISYYEFYTIIDYGFGYIDYKDSWFHPNDRKKLKINYGSNTSHDVAKGILEDLIKEYKKLIQSN